MAEEKKIHLDVNQLNHVTVEKEFTNPEEKKKTRFHLEEVKEIPEEKVSEEGSVAAEETVTAVIPEEFNPLIEKEEEGRDWEKFAEELKNSEKE